MSVPESFKVCKIDSKLGKNYIKANHYSKTCHNGPMCWGLYTKESDLVGVCAFATPCSENVRASIFGTEHKDRVTELHRLHTQDDLPPNTTSWFVSQSLRGLLEYRPKIRAVISFADSTEGHVGTIYKALNFEFCGTTGSAVFYRDQEGRLRHPRQSGVNITTKMASELGWKSEKRDAKNRYILICGQDRREKKYWRKVFEMHQSEREKL